MSKYKVQPKARDAKYVPSYVAKERVEAAASKFFERFSDQSDPRFVARVDVFSPTEYFNNGSWHRGWQFVRTIENPAIEGI